MLSLTCNNTACGGIREPNAVAFSSNTYGPGPRDYNRADPRRSNARARYCHRDVLCRRVHIYVHVYTKRKYVYTYAGLSRVPVPLTRKYTEHWLSKLIGLISALP